MTRPPRVTEILAAAGLGPELGAVPPALLAKALQRGSAVHAAIEADHYGYAAELPPEHAPYLDAYRKFVAESLHEPIASELRVEHPAWGYVGHLDRVGWLARRRAILDWKSGSDPDLKAAGDQLAGYRLAWNACHPDAPVDVLAVVQLRGDGTYRFHDVGPIAHHEEVFLAALVCYRARKERGR